MSSLETPNGSFEIDPDSDGVPGQPGGPGNGGGYPESGFFPEDGISSRLVVGVEVRGRSWSEEMGIGSCRPVARFRIGERVSSEAAVALRSPAALPRLLFPNTRVVDASAGTVSDGWEGKREGRP